MGKSSLTIAISGSYNGNAITKANNDLQKMQTVAASTAPGVAGSLSRIGASAADLGGKIYNAGAKMESFGKAATVYMSLPIAAAAIACGKAAVDIDTSLTNVRKTVDGTEEQYQELKDAAIEFSKTNAVSASQILDIQALGAQLGFTRDELKDFGEVVSGLDIATNMDAEQAGTELAQFANITKMAHGEASNYASALVGLGNTSATTESDISSMAMRIAAAGTQVGMSQADVLGLAASLSSMGIEAEAGGTAISTVMSNIDMSVAKGSDALKGWADQAGMSAEEFASAMATNADQFQSIADSAGMTVKELSKQVLENSDSLSTWASTAGMTADEFSTAWKTDPVQALASVFSGMESATEAGSNMSLMLEDLGIDSVRQTDIMKRLAGNSDLVSKSVATANQEWEANTALQNEVDNRNESMAARFEMLKNKVIAVAESVGTPLVNAALEFVDAAEPVVDVVTEAADAFADMDEEDQRMIVGVVAGVAAFGPLVTIVGKLTMGVGNVVVAFGKGAQALSRVTSGAGEMSTEALKASKSADGLASSTTKAGAGANIASAGMNALGSACKATGIGLAVALVADLVMQLKDYADHKQLVEDATTGMSTAIASVGDAYRAYTPEVVASTDAVRDSTISAEDCLKAQADLAQTMRDTWADYGANAAMVDSYASTIQDLGNKGNLSATEQERLKAAVEGFNETTGSSIGIVNAQTGELSMQKDTILQVAEAYKTEARAEAARELYKETTKQLIQDQISLKDATEQLATAEEGFGLWIGDFPVLADPASVKYHELQQNVNDLASATDSAKSTQDQLLTVMAASGASFESLDAALQSTGANLESFGDAGDDALQALQTNFDGTLNSIVQTCSTQGIAIPSALADGIKANSGLPAESQQVMFDAMVLQMAGGDVEAAAKALGHDIDQGLVDGITGNSDMPEAAIGVMSEDTIAKAKSAFESHSPSQVMHQLGTDIDSGLANGIDGSADKPVTSMSTLGDAVKKAIEGLPIFSSETGTSSGSNLASTIGSFVGSVGSSALSLFSAAKNGVSAMPGELGGVGSSSGSNLATNLGSYYGSVGGQASSLRNAAIDPLSGLPGMAGGYGNDASSKYSSGLGNYLWSAQNAGSSLYSAGARMQITGAYTWGSEAGHNYASGLMSAVSAAANAAMAIAQAAASAIHFSRPDVGPLRYVDEYGSEMVDAWTGGMLANQGAVRDASEQLARAVDLGTDKAAIEAQSEAMSRVIGLNPTVGAYKPTSTFSAGEVGSHSGGNTYNYYTVGDITLDLSSIEDFVTLDQLFDFLRRAKAFNSSKVRA